MLYIDTSVLVAALTREPRTDDVQQWLAAQEAGTLAVSGWTVTEFSSALSVKLRTGAIEGHHRARALSVFHELLEASFTVWRVSSDDFEAAARLADHYASGLRAGDALHLAVAFERGATLCSLDKSLASAAHELGVMAQML